jgi:hypothetical protein
MAAASGAPAEEDEVDARLRRLGAICAPLAAAVVVAVGAIVWVAERDEVSGWVTSPPANSFLVALGAMLLILLSSAAHTRLLRRDVDLDADEAAGDADELAGEADEAAREAADDVAGEAAGEAVAVPPPAVARTARAARSAELLQAFWRATLVSFAMQALAAALGVAVALGGNAPFYGLVICLAALLGMVARWPRRRRFEMLLAEDEAGTPGSPAGGG